MTTVIQGVSNGGRVEVGRSELDGHTYLNTWEEEPWSGCYEDQAPHDIAYLLGRLQEAEARVAEAWDAGALHGYRRAPEKPITSIWDDNPYR